MKTFIYIITILAVSGFIYSVTKEFFPRIETVTKTDTAYVIRIDTVKLERIVYKRLPAKIESVFVDNIQVVQASIDTVVGAHQDTVRVVYLFPPINSFDIYLGLAPRTVEVRDRFITITNDIHHYPSFFEKALWFSAGAGAGVLVGKVLK